MVTCRIADPGDIQPLERLLREIMAHHGVRPPEDEALHRVLTAILGSAQDLDQSPSHLFVVAEDGGEVIGCCALVFSLSTWSATRVCELQDVVVARANRGSGVGSRLLRAAEEVARSRGCARLFLTAEVENLAAHTFYRRLGLAEKTVLYFEQGLLPGRGTGAPGRREPATGSGLPRGAGRGLSGEAPVNDG